MHKKYLYIYKLRVQQLKFYKQKFSRYAGKRMGRHKYETAFIIHTLIRPAYPTPYSKPYPDTHPNSHLTQNVAHTLTHSLNHTLDHTLTHTLTRT